MAGHFKGAKRGTYMLVLYYLAFSVGLLAGSQLKPRYNADMVAYIACARSFEIGDESELHSSVFRELKEAVDPATFERLTKGTPNRIRMTTDATAFREQLAFFKIRPVYNLCIHALSKAGVSIVKASHLVSGLAVFLGIWLLFLIGRPRLGYLFMYLVPPLGLAFGLLDIASLSTPDGLAFLAVVLSVYLFLKRHWLLLALLPACVAVRTDLMIFSSMFAAYLLIFGTHRRLWTAASLASSAFLYVFINRYFGNPGWAVTFYYTLIERVSHPITAGVELTAADYANALLRGTLSLAGDKPFVVYFCVAVASLSLMVKAQAKKGTGWLFEKDISVLVMLPLLYFVIHFAFFPDIDNRYFVPQYLIGAVALFWIVSRRGDAAATQAAGH
jgi:hypothetical protein